MVELSSSSHPPRAGRGRVILRGKRVSRPIRRSNIPSIASNHKRFADRRTSPRERGNVRRA